MNVNGLLKIFKIYPQQMQRNDKYYEVFIFNSHESMYVYYNNTGGYRKCNFDAICRDLEIYKGDITLNKIGEILIPIEKCNINVITHECAHAIFQYMRKFGKIDILGYIDENNCWKGEEMYCDLLGKTVSQFIHTLFILNARDVLI